MDKKCDFLKFLLHLCLILAYVGLLGGITLVVISNFVALPQSTAYIVIGLLLLGGICGVAAGVLNIWR